MAPQLSCGATCQIGMRYMYSGNTKLYLTNHKVECQMLSLGHSSLKESRNNGNNEAADCFFFYIKTLFTHVHHYLLYIYIYMYMLSRTWSILTYTNTQTYGSESPHFCVFFQLRGRPFSPGDVWVAASAACLRWPRRSATSYCHFSSFGQMRSNFFA